MISKTTASLKTPAKMKYMKLFLSILLLTCNAVEMSSTTKYVRRRQATPQKPISAHRRMFGGEDVVLGKPWHHELITLSAIKEADLGFTPGSAEEIAWHAVQIDNYLYNILFWLMPALDNLGDPHGIHKVKRRIQAALSTREDLEKLHADDLFNSKKIIQVLYRYFTGCIAGLHWAAQLYETKDNQTAIDPINAAHNILGVTFHALQDFYSHSNWIDEPSHRGGSIFDYPIPEIQRMFLYTGSYSESGDGLKPHGSINSGNLVCTMAEKGGLFDFLDINTIISAACLVKYAPWFRSELCDSYNRCSENTLERQGEVEGAKALGISYSEVTFGNGKGRKYTINMTWAMVLDPAGIALDNTWISEVGVKERGINLTGAQAFDFAKESAHLSTVQWLQIIETLMVHRLGHSTFWEAFKTESTSSKHLVYPFEKFNYFPFQFLSAGSYPNVTAQDEGYYLRVTLKTSKRKHAGTNANIYLCVDDSPPKLLDDVTFSPSPLIHNDFQSGGEEVYTLGPFHKMPSRIRLFNDAPTLKEVFAQIKADVNRQSEVAAERLADFHKEVTRANAVYVGESHTLMLPDDIERSLQNGYFFSDSDPSGKEWVVRIGSPRDGLYEIQYQLHRLKETESTVKMNLVITSLTSVHPRSSSLFLDDIEDISQNSSEDTDSPSSSDDNDDIASPFILAKLHAEPDIGTQGLILGPFDDMSWDISQRIDLPFQQPLELPKNTGTFILSFRVYESRKESNQSRQALLNEFVHSHKHTISESFKSRLVEALYPDWDVDFIHVYCFHRGQHLQAGDLLFDDRPFELEAKAERIWNTSPERVLSLIRPSRGDIDLQFCTERSQCPDGLICNFGVCENEKE